MKNFILNNKWFIGSFLVWLLLSSSVLLFYTSEQISLKVNSFHTVFFDVFFKYLTHFGEAWFAVPICLFLFYKNKQWGIAAITISVISSLITQFNKHFVFENSFRPSLVLKDYPLHFVDGVEILQYNSFPSGHTTFAFAIFTCLAFLYKTKNAQIFFLIAAVGVAFSRIYLLQHFLRDTIVGSLIGFFCAFILFWFLIEQKNTSNEKSKID